MRGDDGPETAVDAMRKIARSLNAEKLALFRICKFTQMHYFIERVIENAIATELRFNASLVTLFGKNTVGYCRTIVKFIKASHCSFFFHLSPDDRSLRRPQRRVIRHMPTQNYKNTER